MIFRPRRIKSKLLKGLSKLKMDVELIRAGPAALNEIKRASPETFNLTGMAAETTQTHGQKSSQTFECA